MKRKIKLILIIMLIVSLLDSCSGNNNSAIPQNSNETKVVETFKWGIFVDGFQLKKDWTEYEIPKLISENLSIEPVIEIVSKDISLAVSEMILSNKCPDLITLNSSNPSYYQMIKSCAVVKPTEIDEKYYASNRIGKQDFAVDDYSILTGFNETASEGIFINENMYKKIGMPGIYTLNDIIKCIKLYYGKYNFISSDNINFPIVFGINNSDISAFEHMFGVSYEYNDKGVKKNKIYNPQYENILEFLSQIGTNDFAAPFSSDDTETQSKMKESLFFIGDKSYLEVYNSNNPNDKFLNLESFNYEKAFYSKFAENMEYRNIIIDSDKKTVVDKFLKFILSENGNSLLYIGKEDEHWLNVDGQPVIQDWVTNELQTSTFDFVQKTGIGIVPFFYNSGRYVLPLKKLWLPSTGKAKIPLKSVEMGIQTPITLKGSFNTTINDEIMKIYVQAAEVGGVEGYESARKQLSRLRESKLLSDYMKVNN